MNSGQVQVGEKPLSIDESSNPEVYNPGHHKLLIDSPLFPEQCAAFTVTK